jgi:hypothetical protein
MAYEDDIEEANASEDPIASLNKARGWTDTEEAPAKKQTFKEAFAGAKDGSTFEWNGKKYKKEYASAKPKATDAGREGRRGTAPAAYSNEGRNAPSKTESLKSDTGKKLYGGPSIAEDLGSFAKKRSADMQSRSVGSTLKDIKKSKGLAEQMQGYAKGGSVKGWGQARGSKKAKVY